MRSSLLHIISVMALLSMCALVPSSLAAQATGLSCDDPIRVDSTFSVTLPMGSYWLAAETYDLPLRVYYFPLHFRTQTPPVVTIDFSCTPGVYEDPKVAAVVAELKGYGVDFPYTPTLKTAVVDNRDCYVLSYSREVVASLENFGVNYSIPVYVHLTTYGQGDAIIENAKAIKDCSVTSTPTTLPGKIQLAENDTNIVFLMPVRDWRADSVFIHWSGTAPLRFWIGTNCEFHMDGRDELLFDLFDMNEAKDTTGYVYTISAYDMDRYKRHAEDGFYMYFRCQSTSAGTITMERLLPPFVEPDPCIEMTKIDLDVPFDCVANDTFTVRYVTDLWKGRAVVFSSESKTEITMVCADTCRFSVDDMDHVIGRYKFVDDGEGGQECPLSLAEMDDLWSRTKDGSIYIKFVTSSDISIMAYTWIANSCVKNSFELYLGDSIWFENTDAVRVKAIRWQYDSVMLRWSGQEDAQLFVSKTCSYNMTETNKNVLDILPLKSGDTTVIRLEQLSQWEPNADRNGYIYFRVKKGNGYLYAWHNILSKDEEPIHATIGVICEGDNFLVVVSESQQISLQDRNGKEINSWYQTKEGVPYSFVQDGQRYVIQGAYETIYVE